METLYALAGMFPNIEADRSNNLDGVSSEASPSALQEASERLEPKLEGKPFLISSTLSIKLFI